MQSPCI